MELSPYVRLWLDNATGPNSCELKNYVRFLESEVERLKYFSPYPEDNENKDSPESLNPTTALFNKYGG